MCQRCNDFYIGESCRPFHFRFIEHMRSLALQDCKSALSQHANENHNHSTMSAEDFDLEVIAKRNSPIETRLTEAKMIRTLKPPLNRRNEY